MADQAARDANENKKLHTKLDHDLDKVVQARIKPGLSEAKRRELAAKEAEIRTKLGNLRGM